MAEKILIKTVGGPENGKTRVIDREQVSWSWPPPLNINVPGYSGYYLRESFSELPEQDEDTHIMRGAQYKWMERDALSREVMAHAD